jgi:hypothetical protein
MKNRFEQHIVVIEQFQATLLGKNETSKSALG